MQPPDQPGNDAGSAARAVSRALRNALGNDLHAVYLHGSAVLGGFRWDRSDLDILALSRGAVSNEQVRRVVDALARLSYPANGLEFTLMTAQESAAPPAAAPRFQLHITTPGSGHPGRVVDGRTGAGDPDLVLHLAVGRQRGVTVFGPPPSVTLAAIRSEAVLAAMRDEIGWARANASLEYFVLTCARAWLFAETRQIASKVEAGEWAAQRYPDPPVIAAALSRQRGADAVISRDAAERLATHVDRLVASGDLEVCYRIE
jgi:hypothetical protein